MSFSASINNPSGFGEQQVVSDIPGQSQQPAIPYMDTSIMSQNPQPNVLNHIMKQINSLKVENLELKKMVNSQMRSGSNKRRVSISE